MKAFFSLKKIAFPHLLFFDSQAYEGSDGLVNLRDVNFVTRRLFGYHCSK